MQFGLAYGINNSQGKPTTEAAFAILDRAHAAGIELLDSAEGYGDALAVIGQYHAARAHRFAVISKFKINAETNLEQAVRQTITTLQIDALWGYMYHNFDDYLAQPNTLTDLVRLKQQGLIARIGASVYGNEQLEIAIENPHIDFIQLPYNLLDNKAQRGELLARAKVKGKIIHIRSVYLQGLFFKNTDEISPDSKLYSLKLPIAALQDLAKAADKPLQQIALQYALQNNNIDGVLTGVDTLEQLNQNIALAENTLPTSFFDTIDTIRVENIALLNPANW